MSGQAEEEEYDDINEGEEEVVPNKEDIHIISNKVSLGPSGVLGGYWMFAS